MRPLRAGITALWSLALVTCTENPVAPHRGALGYLSVQPVFDASALFAPLTIDNVRLIVIRPPSDVIKTISQSFPPGTDSLQLTASQIPLNASSEDLLVTIELYAGTTLLFSGTQTITVTAGQTPTPAPLPVQYQGPGADIATLSLAPRDTTVGPGAAFTLRVTATDSQQAPLTSFYVGWKAPGATITGAGLFTAPATRDTIIVTVSAPAPNTTKDSTRVFIVPAPGSLAIAGGDGQTALAGTRLPQVLAVRVNGTDNLPLPGIPVTFAATTGGGGVDSATATTDAQGIARTGATLGSAVGPQTFTASRTGLTSVVFTETATAAVGGRTWTGAVNTDWSTAGNWNPQAIPTSADDVVIPSGPSNMPTVTSSCSARTLTVNSGATLGLGAVNCQVAGNVFADGAITGTGAVQIATPAQIRGNVPSLILSGLVTQTGTVTATGSVTVTGTAGSLVIGGQALTVGGNLATQSGARLVMLNPADLINVLGNASFAGGFELDSLAAGVLSVGGNFSQDGTGSGDSFHPSGTHQTIFTGTSSTITFGSPGDIPGTSHFQGLRYAGTGTLTLGSDVYAHGVFTTTSTSAITIGSAAGRLLQVGSVGNAGPVVFSNVRLSLSEPAGGPLALSNATFSGLPGTATQLSVSHPGVGGPFTFTNLTFSVTPTTGFYLSATDNNPSDGTPLTIAVTGSTPATGAPFVQVAGGAVVNWSATGGRTWTGTTSTDWSTPGNWNPQTVPTSADDVVIPSGTPNVPTVTSSCAARSITVNSGAQLNLGTFNCQVSGNVAVSGTTLGTGSFQLVAPGSVSGNLRGLIVNSQVSLGGLASIGGALTVSGAGSSFNMNGLSAAVSGNLTVQSGGLLIMQNAADNLSVIGNAAFDGGSEAGQLTAGLLVINGNFSQAATTSGASYSPSGTHLTQLGTISLTVTFATPGTGTGASHFQELFWGGNGTLTLGSDVYASGTFSMGSSTPVTITSAAGRLLQVANYAASNATTFNNVRLALSSTTPVSLALSNVTFQNMPTTASQLTVSNTGAGGPFTFTSLTFLTPPQAPNGFYLDVTDIDGGTNGSLTINMVTPNPTSGGGFVRTTGGASVVWPASVPVTWSGTAATTDWNTASNWVGGVVPGPADSAVIKSGTNQPVLTASVTVGALEIQGNVDVNGQTLVVNGTLVTTGTGVLTMKNGQNLDNVQVGGSAIFNGGSTNGTLVSGHLQIGGTFTQLATTSTASFAASAGHTTTFTSPDALISFQTPGTNASHFGNLSQYTYGAKFTISSDVTVLGFLSGGDGFGGTVNGACGSVLTVPYISGGATLDCISLFVDDPAGTYASLDNIRLVNQANTVDQITIRHPGLVGANYNFNNITFAALASGTGHYINAIDADGPSPVSLVVNVTSTNPGNGPTFTKTDGIARVVWPAAGGIIWTGATSTDWNTATNWTSGTVPAATDNVAIPANATNEPTISAPAVAGSLTVDAGATLTISNALLILSGNLTAQGSIIPVGSGGINLTGASNSISGDVGFVSLQAGSSYYLSGFTNATTVQVPGGTLYLNGNLLGVSGNFSTSGTGTLGMTLPQDQLLVQGNATFAGGSTDGLLTAGSLVIYGDFIQQATNSTTSFAPSGSHLTVLGDATAHQMSFGSPGAGSGGSHFQNLDVSGATGGLTLTVNSIVQGFLSANNAGGTPKLSGGGASLTVQQFAVNGLIVDNLPLIVLEGATALGQSFDNVTFQGFPTTGTTMLSITGPGGTVAARPTFSTSNLTFQALPIGAGNLYVSLVSSNGGIFTLTMTGSNQSPQAGGNGPALSNPPNQTTVAGATINWP